MLLETDPGKDRPLFLLVLLLACTLNSLALSHQTSPPDPTKIANEIRRACESATHVLAVTILPDTSYYENNNGETLLVLSAEVDSAYKGDISPDSTIVFTSAGALELAPSDRYILFFESCEGRPYLRNLPFLVSARVNGDSAQYRWEDTRRSLSEVEGQLIDALEKSSFSWAAANADVAIRGVVGDWSLNTVRHPWSVRSGTIFINAPVALKEDSIGVGEAPVAIVLGNVESRRVTVEEPVPRFKIGEECIVFLVRRPTGELALLGGIYSKWSVDDSLATVYGPDTYCNKAGVASISLQNALEVFE